MKSSTIGLAFIKFLQDGSQNNSQCCINKCAWTSANKIWIAMIKKVTPSCTESSLVTKHGSTITSLSVNGRVWNGNIHNRLSGKSSKASHQQENWCLQFFGAHKAQYWNIIRRGVQQQTVLVTVRCLLTGWSLKFKANAEDNCRKAVCCCMTMPVRILLPTQLKPSTLMFVVLAHPPYSPDLGPSDYHQFGPLKEALRGRRFTLDQ